jgi:hypothetical protein
MSRRLESSRLVLRPPGPDDLAAYVAVVGDEDAERQTP